MKTTGGPEALGPSNREKRTEYGRGQQNVGEIDERYGGELAQQLCSRLREWGHEGAVRQLSREVPEHAFVAVLALLEGAARSPNRAALYARLSGALCGAVEELGEAEVAEMLSMPSDYRALIRVLDTPTTVARLTDKHGRQSMPSLYFSYLSAAPDAGTNDVSDDRTAVRRVKTSLDSEASSGFLDRMENRARVLEEEGGTVTASEAAQLLGVSRQAIDKRRRAGKIIGVSTGKRGFRYPVWQFDAAAPSGILVGLEEVLADLTTLEEWDRAEFLLTERVDLGDRRVLDALRDREIDIEEVRASAKRKVNG